MNCKPAVAAFLFVFCCLNCASANDTALELKIAQSLRNLPIDSKETLIPISVLVSGDVDLGRLMDVASVFDRDGIRIITGRISAGLLEKVASIGGVEAILDNGPREAPVDPEPLESGYKPTPVSGAALDAALKSAPPYSQTRAIFKSKMQKSEDKGWWLKSILGTEEAHSRGIMGDGVKVGIIDSGVDFATPDLMGTQARIEDPSSPHNGWPICFDAFSIEQYFFDGDSSNMWFADTSTTSAATLHGATATATVSIPTDATPETRTYIFYPESVSGVYHFGLHPDRTLEYDILGEPAGVLVVDVSDNSRGPGYNTVYVDLDGDYDFTDEKPCFRGDEISYRDIYDASADSSGADGYADLSGGMIYFIANGERPFPVADWLYGIDTPVAAGNMVAFMICDEYAKGGEHGTLCASSVVAQGIVNGGAPSYKPPYAGPGDGLVQGLAPHAKIVSIGNFYAGGTLIYFYLFSIFGYDGVANSGDEPNILSMSYGYGSVDNDSWDVQSRLIASLNMKESPKTTFFKSSGNGGPGYATVNSPGSPTLISVGASTSYDTMNVFDSIRSATQIVYDEVQSWSDAGPRANGDTGVDIVAGGAWATGSLPVNMVRNGWNASEQWGGTSRSCPDAAGAGALVCQAWKQKHGEYPDYKTVRGTLMNSAVDLKYDVYRQGSGRIHAGRAVKLALGESGVKVHPSRWVPGDYHGVKYDAYANLVKQGATYTQTFEITNPTSLPQDVSFSDVSLEEFDHVEYAVDAIPKLNVPSSFRRPDYLVPLHVSSGKGGILGAIPEETALMEIQLIYPFENFDFNYVSGDPSTIKPPNEAAFYLLAYDWTDIDGDGMLYDDSLGQVPGLVEPGEIDSDEYMRFNYAYNNTTSQRMYVSKPLEKMHDGIWLGIQRYNKRSNTVPVKILVTFYRESNCPWLSVSQSELSVPANSVASITATVAVPADMRLGSYSAKLIARSTFSLDGAGRKSYAPDLDRIVVPVSINVSADLGADGISISGATEDLETYKNYEVSGNFDWGDRSESGDGRFFFLDVQSAATGEYLFTRTQWQDIVPTDIDTLILGPTKDVFTTPGNDYYSPQFGPNTLTRIGGLRSPGRPDWLFQTSTNGPMDYSYAKLTTGLHSLFVHNILFSGQNFRVPYTVDIGRMKILPDPLAFTTHTADFVGSVTMASSVLIEDITATAYGPTMAVDILKNRPIAQKESVHALFPIAKAARIDLRLTGSAADIDLYLYRDGADDSIPDGQFSENELIASSETATSVESILLSFPKDGLYQATVYGFGVTSITEVFTLQSANIEGTSIAVTLNPKLNLDSSSQLQILMSSNLPHGPGAYNSMLVLGYGSIARAMQLTFPIFYAAPDTPTPTATETNTPEPTPTLTSTYTPEPTPTATPTIDPNACADGGYYILTSFGQHIPVGNPVPVTGSLAGSEPIFEDMEMTSYIVHPEKGVFVGGGLANDLAILDKYGVATFISNPEVTPHQQFLFNSPEPFGYAVDIVVSRDAKAFWVLTESGGIFRAGDANIGGTSATAQLGNHAADLAAFLPIPFGPMRNPVIATPNDNASIRAVALVVVQASEELKPVESPNSHPEGFIVLDSQGASYLFDSQGYSIRGPQAAKGFFTPGPGVLNPETVYPFFPGLDIARDMELHPEGASASGLVIYDGWGGVHPVPVNQDTPVAFLRNETSIGSGIPITTVGLPYIIAGFDNPETAEDESLAAADVNSIFIDIEFCANGPQSGVYTLDKFGGVFAFGSTRNTPDAMLPRFSNSPYFYPFFYAVDLEAAGPAE